jgi:hypothetical protein
MNWDFSSFTNVGYLVILAVTIFGIFWTRRTKPKPIKKIVIRSKQSDPSVGLFLLGGILGYLIGSIEDDEGKDK